MFARALLAPLLAAAAFAASCQATPAPAPAPPAPAAPSMAEMSEEDMLAMMMELAAPGVGHGIFEALKGTWQVELSMVTEPGGEPELSSGTSKNEMLLGGRFLKTEFEGSAMGMPFEGFGLLGYNNSTSQYEGFWIDNFGTLMSPLSHGSYDPQARKLTMHRTIDDPAFGKMVMREEYVIENPDRHTLEMYLDQGAGEYRSMRIVYTRK